PQPNQAAKQAGETKQEYQQQMAEKRREAVQNARAQDSQSQSVQAPTQSQDSMVVQSSSGAQTQQPSSQSSSQSMANMHSADAILAAALGNNAKGKQTNKPAASAESAEVQLARVQGPQRIVVELSMAKLDRAIYSNRQLEAVMEDFWFNHFNVFAGKGDDRWL